MAYKGKPYGKARFEEMRRGNIYYMDKTRYLPLLEEMGDYLFLIRPRRLGKSLFVSMLKAYYDQSKEERFDGLFDGLWIEEHSTHGRALKMILEWIDLYREELMAN